MVAAAVAWLCALSDPAAAGKMLYQQCFTALGDTADGFKASLQAGGRLHAAPFRAGMAQSSG